MTREELLGGSTVGAVAVTVLTFRVRDLGGTMGVGRSNAMGDTATARELSEGDECVV